MGPMISQESLQSDHCGCSVCGTPSEHDRRRSVGPSAVSRRSLLRAGVAGSAAALLAAAGIDLAALRPAFGQTALTPDAALTQMMDRLGSVESQESFDALWAELHRDLSGYWEPRAGKPLPFGTGAKLGYGPVLGIDVEEAAVEATRANAEANGVEVEARLADGAQDPLPRADVAVANISLADVQRLRPDSERVVTSGYLASERAELPGYAQVGRREADGWAADLHEREKV